MSRRRKPKTAEQIAQRQLRRKTERDAFITVFNNERERFIEHCMETMIQQLQKKPLD